LAKIKAMKKIHVGFLLSYDYEKLKHAIPPVYQEADAIFIAQDIENRTWNGKKFEVNQNFINWLEAFDTENKITIYKDDFYIPELSTIQNDTRERQMLSEKMGIGNWLVQVDADEYFVNFKEFVETLRKYDHFLENPKANQVQIAGFLVNMYKQVEDGVFYVNHPTKVFLATNYPSYKRARQTKKRIIYTDHLLLHECIARKEEELLTKLKNWGHNKEIDLEGFMHKWRTVNKENYKEMENFFYLKPEVWKTLEFVPGNSIEKWKVGLNQKKELHPSSWFLFHKNLGQYFKHLFKK
jgi:hypothetical protein